MKKIVSQSVNPSYILQFVVFFFMIEFWSKLTLL